jgi:hypothetical protein
MQFYIPDRKFMVVDFMKDVLCKRKFLIKRGLLRAIVVPKY